MALDARTVQMMGNTLDRNRTTAVQTARTIRDRAEDMLKVLATGGMPTESLTELSVVLDTRLAALQTQHELAEIISADGT